MKSLPVRAALASAVLVSTLATLATLPAVAAPAQAATPTSAAAEDTIRAVYHINEADKARPLLANVRNHLRDDPFAQIVVVANSAGIEFLLKDAADKAGVPYADALVELQRQGVKFRVCRNTLTARKLGDDAVAADVGVVQAGVGEIARLQARQGYVYIKP